MKVLLLGMEGEFVDNSTSGIIKYMHALYSEMGKMNGIEIKKTEYKKIAKKLPWANHSIFYLESKFTNFKGYDVIHNPNSIRLFAKPKNSKLVTTIHNVMFASEKVKDFDNTMRSKLVSWNTKLSNYASLHAFNLSLKSDHIIADSGHGKDEILNLVPDYDKNKISVVTLGIDNKFISDNKIEPMDKEKNIFKVGYLGSFNYYQNIPTAIKAVKMIKDPNIRFEMWGDKSIESALLEKEASDDKRIVFKYPVIQDRKVAIYESFDVFVQPGVYEGIPVMEALARGVPVIVFKNIQMIPETKQNCFVAEDEAAMAKIIEDIKSNGYNESKRKKAMDYARSFSWRRTVEETVNVYNKVITQG